MLILKVRTKYITSFDVSGFARPWMLAWRSDFGTSGLYDPDMFLELIQLIMSEGFLTDPDQISVEKLSCCQVPTCFLDGSYEAMPNLYQHLLPPFSVGYLKGWKRALGLLTVLAAIRELNLESCVGHSFLVIWIAMMLNFVSVCFDTVSNILRNTLNCSYQLVVSSAKFPVALRRHMAQFTSTLPSRMLTSGQIMASRGGTYGVIYNIECKVHFNYFHLFSF